MEPSAPKDVCRIHLATPDDIEFLRQMVFEAGHYRDPRERTPEVIDEALRDPGIAKYIAGWGRPGDAAVIAESADGVPAGAAWYRLFTADQPGYGFIDPTIPELGIAVLPAYRGRGIGGALIDALLQQAGTSGFAVMSLSVREDNPATRLYCQHDFVRVLSGPAVTSGTA